MERAMTEIPKVFQHGFPACVIYDGDSPEKVVEKIESSVYAIDGRTHATELLPDYYQICKRQVKKPTVERHKFF